MANDFLVERQHYLITPTDPAQKAVTEAIEKAMRNELIGTLKIRLNPIYPTTITCVYLEAIIRTLVKLMRENKGEASINFLDLMTISCNNRENDDADKDGNINVVYKPGKTVESIMDRDYAPVMNDENVWKDTIINVIERECSRILKTKHKMNGNNDANWTKISYLYLVYLFKTLKMMAKVGLENGQVSVMVNFLEMFEAHANIEQVPSPDNPDLIHEEFTIKIRPGFSAKLLIKDDNVTEVSDDDDDTN